MLPNNKDSKKVSCKNLVLSAQINLPMKNQTNKQASKRYIENCVLEPTILTKLGLKHIQEFNLVRIPYKYNIIHSFCLESFLSIKSAK